MGRRFVRKKLVQLTLDDARKETGRGGWRRRAGRKKKPGAVSHDARPSISAHHPQHVTIRTLVGAPVLARRWLMALIRRTIAESHKPDFRIIEFNVLANHVHLIVEAANREALARGAQGFQVRLVKRLNSALKRCGKLFSERYHARSLTSPREAFNALRYVLLNRKHHAAEKKFNKYWVDPFSSGPWFTGWAEPLTRKSVFAIDLAGTPAPTLPATVWLLTAGWKQHGPLRFDDRPA